MTWNIVRNVLNNTNKYCPILLKNAQYCQILPNIAQYIQKLYNIVLYCSILLKWLFQLTLTRVMILQGTFQNCPIYPNIVRNWLILYSIDQYCPVISCLDIFLLKLNLSHFKSDLDVVIWAICKYASMQVWKCASMQ